jgi:signal peptidase I
MADDNLPLPPRPDSQHILSTPTGAPPGPELNGLQRRRAEFPAEGRVTFADRLKSLGKHLGLLLAAIGLLTLLLAAFGVTWKTAAISATLLVIVVRVLADSYLGKPREKAAASGGPPPTTDSTREIIETVVFVVVLVLMLKSFAAEAFVIPTGSMAETLWGYQKVVTCPKCKYEFPVNCSNEVDPNDGPPSPIYACICPNCRQHIHFPSAYSVNPNYAADHPRSVEIPDPGPSSGDRVLVAKFAYEMGRKPNRLDVVVFKFPGNDKDQRPSDAFPRSGPNKGHSPMNYIKRLVGLERETIAIHGGDVYYLSPDKSPQYQDQDQGVDPALLWQREYMKIDKAVGLFKDGQFQIIRKPPETILAMKRLVYDNDHPASDLKEYPRWQNKGDWTSEGEHGFHHQVGADKDWSWLRYQNLIRNDPDPQLRLITDFMGYNTGDYGSGRSHNSGANWVGDLILEGEVVIDQAQGELALELARGVDRFQAVFDLAAGTCILKRLPLDGKEQELARKNDVRLKPGKHRLRLANVDQKLTLWVDDGLPFGEEGTVYAPPPRDKEGPWKENDLERPASIGVKGAGVTVRHLRLDRDSYYTTGQNNDPSQPDVSGVNFAEPNTWEGLRELPTRTYYIHPGHYLCLGDNSPESSDGRSWGTVPQRLLLGRAVLVYYPFSRAGRIR